MNNATQLTLSAVVTPCPKRSEIKAFYAWLRDNEIDRASGNSGGEFYRKGDYTLTMDLESTDDTYILTRWECCEERVVGRHEYYAGLAVLAAVEIPADY